MPMGAHKINIGAALMEGLDMFQRAQAQRQQQMQIAEENRMRQEAMIEDKKRFNANYKLALETAKLNAETQKLQQQYTQMQIGEMSKDIEGKTAGATLGGKVLNTKIMELDDLLKGVEAIEDKGFMGTLKRMGQTVANVPGAIAGAQPPQTEEQFNKALAGTGADYYTQKYAQEIGAGALPTQTEMETRQAAGVDKLVNMMNIATQMGERTRMSALQQGITDETQLSDISDQAWKTLKEMFPDMNEAIYNNAYVPGINAAKTAYQDYLRSVEKEEKGIALMGRGGGSPLTGLSKLDALVGFGVEPSKEQLAQAGITPEQWANRKETRGTFINWGNGQTPTVEPSATRTFMGYDLAPFYGQIQQLKDEGKSEAEIIDRLVKGFEAQGEEDPQAMAIAVYGYYTKKG